MPVILISKQYSTGKPLVDAKRLSRLLAGTSVVYESATSLVDKELEYLSDFNYRCWNGRIRAYQPGLDFNHDGDVTSLGSEAIEEFLIRGIARRSPLIQRGAVSNLEEVEAKIQSGKFSELRDGARNSEELAALLEDENRRLELELTTVQQNKEYWRGEAGRLQGVEEELGLKNYRIETLTKEASDARHVANAMGAQSSFLENLASFPTSVLEVVALAEQAYPGRIVFAGKAKDSARRATMRDMSVVWQYLKGMATTLYDLHFEKDLSMVEIAKEFKYKTGFDLAMGESESTKNNRYTASLRSIRYKN